MHPDLPNPPIQDPNNRRQVRLAREADLAFVLDLTKRNTNALGFIPAQGVAEYIRARLVTLAMENDEPAGFLLGKHHAPHYPGTTMIHQACICYDARRRQLGLQLVKRVTAAAAAAGNGALQLWCRGELDANDFWHAAGFEAVALRPGGDRRGIPQILWRTPTVRGAILNNPPSARRRGRAGHAVMKPAEITTQMILDIAQTGGLPALLDDWRRRNTQLHEPDAIATPAEINAAHAEEVALTGRLLRASGTSQDEPSAETVTPIQARRAHTGGFRTPPGARGPLAA